MKIALFTSTHRILTAYRNRRTLRRPLSSYQRLLLFIVDCFNETEPEKKDEGGDSSDKQEEKEENEAINEENSEENKREDTGKKEKKSKGKASKEKTKDEKKHKKKEEKTGPSKEDDSEKIQRLIKQQAKEQQEGRRSRKKEFARGRMNERKRHELQMRLREIHDVDRLRRELRKIRTREMTEDDYAEREPWERDMDSSIPEEVRRDMRRHRFDRMEDPEDLRRELRMRIIDLEDDEDDGYFLGENSFVFRELHQRYMMEAEEIRDPTELKKRIDDLDALSAIFHGERDHGRVRGRYRRPHRDEL